MEQDAIKPDEGGEQWWEQSQHDGELTRERYKFYMRPEPTEILGPIEEVDDELTGRVLRRRMINVPMIRGGERKPMEVFLDPLPHVRIKTAKQLQGWYQSRHWPTHDETGASLRKRPRPCFTDAMLTEPYGGYCAVGCAFCYINSGFKGYRGSGLITVPVNYGDQIRRQLSRLRSGTAGYFSSFTDPFLPLEDLYHNTQRGAEAFVEQGLPIFFLSRVKYPEWAYDLLSKNKYSYMQKSINCADQDTWKRLSPGAISLEEHCAEIAEARRRGIYVSIQVNPIVPGVVDHDHVIRTFEMLAEAGANHVIIKFVEAGFNWAPTMIERIRKRFPDERADEFERLFTQNIGGQRTIEEPYRMQGHELYRKAATRLGMTYATCYEYKWQRDAQGEVVNKVGVSIGSDYLTADQCHGHRVPMFTRDDMTQPFQEVEECPPSGCLTCGKGDNPDEVPCGSELFGSAKALRYPDFKNPVRPIK